MGRPRPFGLRGDVRDRPLPLEAAGGPDCRADGAGGQHEPDVAAETRKLFTIARIDYVVLFLVVAVMVAKPTGDDVGLLVALGAVLAAAVAYTVWQARSAAETPPRPPAGETA